MDASCSPGRSGRGRRSIALDLRRPGGGGGRAAAVRASDALIEGFRPGVAERLGVGPDAALARNPQPGVRPHDRLGADRPARGDGGTRHHLPGGRPAFCTASGPPDGPPAPPVNYLADFGGGAMFAGRRAARRAAARAVHRRGPGGRRGDDRGRRISRLDDARDRLAAGGWLDSRGANILDGGAPNYRCYECADGRYVAVGALEPKFWQVLVETLGLDVATVASPYDRAEWPALTALLAETFATKSRDEWAEMFAPLDACVAPGADPGRGAGPSAQCRARLVRRGRGRHRGRAGARFSGTATVAGEPRQPRGRHCRSCSPNSATSSDERGRAARVGSDQLRVMFGSPWAS